MRHIFFSFLLACTTICHASPNLTTSACNCDLPAPQNLKAEEVGTTYATLRWDAVAGAVGYQVSLLDTLDALISTTFTAEATAFEEDLEPGSTYKYRVAAVCLGGGVSTLFSIVAIKPVIVDLVISLEKPKGLFDIICEQDIVGSAECSFNAATDPSIIGEVSRKSTGEKMKFQLRYVSGNGGDKLILNMVGEIFESKPFFKPSIKSNNNKIEDKNIQFANLLTEQLKICKIRFDRIGSLLFTVIVENPVYNDLVFKLIKTSPIIPNTFHSANERHLNTFEVFPNPCSNQLTISNLYFSQDKITAKIYTLEGNLESTILIDTINNTISVDHLVNGFHIIKIESETMNRSIKFVKN